MSRETMEILFIKGLGITMKKIMQWFKSMHGNFLGKESEFHNSVSIISNAVY